MPLSLSCVEKWRAYTGSSSCGIGGPAVSIIFYLLLLSGDVELNPGPTILSAPLVFCFLCFITTSLHLVCASPIICYNDTTGESTDCGRIAITVMSAGGIGAADIATLVATLAVSLIAIIVSVGGVIIASCGFWLAVQINQHNVIVSIQPDGDHNLGDKDYHLTCSVNRFFDPDSFTFEWYKLDETKKRDHIYNNAINNGPYQITSPKSTPSTLTFRNLSNDNAGRYVCKFTQKRCCFPVMSIFSSPQTVNINNDPALTIVPIVEKHNGPPRIECNIHFDGSGSENIKFENPHPNTTITYEWKRGDDVQPQHTSTYNLAGGEAGIFTCTATATSQILGLVDDCVLRAQSLAPGVVVAAV